MTDATAAQQPVPNQNTTAASRGQTSGSARASGPALIARAHKRRAERLNFHLTGDMAVDRPAERRRVAEEEVPRDREFQRRLEIARQSRLQPEQVRREIEQQRLSARWERGRSY